MPRAGVEGSRRLDLARERRILPHTRSQVTHPGAPHRGKAVRSLLICRSVARPSGLDHRLRPSPVAQEFHGTVLGLVTHLRRVLDPETQIEVRKSPAPALVDLAQHGVDAEAPPRQIRVEERVDRRQGIREHVRDRHGDERVLPRRYRATPSCTRARTGMSGTGGATAGTSIRRRDAPRCIAGTGRSAPRGSRPARRVCANRRCAPECGGTGGSCESGRRERASPRRPCSPRNGAGTSAFRRAGSPARRARRRPPGRGCRQGPAGGWSPRGRRSSHRRARASGRNAGSRAVRQFLQSPRASTAVSKRQTPRRAGSRRLCARRSRNASRGIARAPREVRCAFGS